MSKNNNNKNSNEEISLQTDTHGLGLSGKDFKDIPDWELYGFANAKEYAYFLEHQKPYEFSGDEDE